MEHQLILCKNGLSGVSVAEVTAFSDREIRLNLCDERKLTVSGEGLKIVNFSKDTGELSVSGKISGVTYREKGEKIIKRLFK